jgi:1-acyl-sn-glycerol-3-phosphate acyltransferase
MVSSILAALLKLSIFVFSFVVTGARAIWLSATAPLLPLSAPCVFIANHRSHGDFALLWSVLPAAVRRKTRPVVGAEYWQASWLRRLIAERVLRAVLVERSAGDVRQAQQRAIDCMYEALQAGDALIVFPEGTRNLSDEKLLPLKSGLYFLAQRCPNLHFIPAWIDNLHRVMPKGEVIPLPLLCSVRIGAAFAMPSAQDKAGFLADMRAHMLSLSQTDAANASAAGDTPKSAGAL